VAVFSAILSVREAGSLCSIGTLLALVIVSISVLVLVERSCRFVNHLYCSQPRCVSIRPTFGVPLQKGVSRVNTRDQSCGKNSMICCNPIHRQLQRIPELAVQRGFLSCPKIGKGKRHHARDRAWCAAKSRALSLALRIRLSLCDSGEQFVRSFFFV